MSNVVKVALSRELNTHRGPVNELELHEPLAASFRKYGEAVKAIPIDNDRVRFEYVDSAVLGFLTDMSGLDPVILDTLSASDYLKLRATMTNMVFGIGDGALGNRPT